MSTTYTLRSRRHGNARPASANLVCDAPRRTGLSILETVTLIVIAVLLIAGAMRVQPQVAPTETTQLVQVQTGQTLWEIAQAHPIAGLTTAQTADAISRSNHLSSSMLMVGQTLRVPLSGSMSPQLASR